MKLVDSNIWLALSIPEHRFHEPARRWLGDVNEAGAILFCRATQLSVLRLLTTNAVFAAYGNSAMSNQQAWSVYEGLLADPRIEFCHEPAALEVTWKTLAARQTTSPKVWMDSYLAAFAIAGGHQFVTIDKAFRQHARLDLVLLSES